MIQVIGRRDRADFPEFGLFDIEAKVDTGAFTSALHCAQVKVIEVKGIQKISFHILDAHRPDVELRRFATRFFTRKKIKNSFGQSELRYVIKTKIVLFGRTIRAEFSLADRTEMRYPVLLGRKLLRNKFIVDVTHADLSYQQKKDTFHN